MSSFRRLICVLGVAGAVLVSPALAAAQQADTHPSRTFRPTFHMVSRQALALAGNDGLVFVESAAPGGMLFGAKGSRPIDVPAPPLCTTWYSGTPLLGGGVLLHDCQALEMYSQQTSDPGVWTALDPSAAEAECERYQQPSGACWPVAVGTRWIRYGAECYHCSTHYFLVSTTTGAVRGDPTNGRFVADLNALNPTRERCAHVSARPGGSVTFVGNRALVSATSSLSTSTYFIERCRSSTRMKLPDLFGILGSPNARVATNDHLIAWYSVIRSDVEGLDGVTDRRFSLRLPRGAAPLGNLALTATDIYIERSDGAIVAARLPTALR